MSIRVKTLDAAVAEAKRFLRAAETLKQVAVVPDWSKKHGNPLYEGGQHCAAVKRASMDLSRALAGLRRGGG